MRCLENESRVYNGSLRLFFNATHSSSDVVSTSGQFDNPEPCVWSFPHFH